MKGETLHLRRPEQYKIYNLTGDKMNNQEHVNRIVEFLERQHRQAVDWTHEPYMRFTAEVQDWSASTPGMKIIFLGYFFEQNGDLVGDPVLTVVLRDGRLEKVQMVTVMGTTHKLPLDDPYVGEFLSLVWDRHFERAARETPATETV
jgi:hypothetical protein